MDTQRQGSTKNVFYLGLVSFFTDAASAMVNPVLPLFLVIVLSTDMQQVGVVLAVTTVVSYLLRFVSGSLSDRFDRNKPMLILGYSISALAKPLFSTVGAWQEVAALKSVERFGKALRAAPKDKLIGLSSKKGKEGKGFGLHKAMDVAGEFSGLAVLLLVMVYFGTSEETFRTLFLFTIIPGLLAVLVLAFWVRDVKGGVSKKKSTVIKLEPSLKTPVVTFCFMAMCSFGEAFFLLLGNEQGMSLPTLLTILVVIRASQFGLSFLIININDRLKPVQILSFGYALGLAAMTILYLSPQYLFILAFAVSGIHDLIVVNAIRTHISKFASNKGAAFGMFYLLYAIFSAVGLALVGWLWESYGSQFAILACLIGSACVFIIHLLSTKPLSLKTTT
ncbi:putative Permease of the major facilitator superfamily [Vibrio nigripulchritudo SOn1]|uniref:Permease of the major facilitator superfamily n=1 Tax=Vibrio nigripulchritudo SOn1 TaxID=1238450 RepID=A0AAV2VX43_9VIBR|nr:MFS transporter [Vibrio nigripulchritudo]CCO48988.1 putative Permease of the major facilitator superfamily [Vibrio nigripulchritudo SOn1]